MQRKNSSPPRLKLRKVKKVRLCNVYRKIKRKIRTKRGIPPLNILIYIDFSSKKHFFN